MKKIIILIGLCIILLIGCKRIYSNQPLDDCAYPNHCPYTNECVPKDADRCINPETNLSYMEEIEKDVGG